MIVSGVITVAQPQQHDGGQAANNAPTNLNSASFDVETSVYTNSILLDAAVCFVVASVVVLVPNSDAFVHGIFCCVGGRPSGGNAEINQNLAFSQRKAHSALSKNMVETTIPFDCRLYRLFVVEIGVWCQENTVVLCCGIFFVVWAISTGSHSAINLFLVSSCPKKYAKLEYNGGLFVLFTFRCRNCVLVAAMVRSSLQGRRSNKKAVTGLQRTLRR